ncbi:MAG: hypothetical protein QOI11_3190 [Candidatus Eremiobacteraeota bacterium]|nr:hypothetical protein [Candidatus Eremiobacteraeota bacterium]
MITLAFERVTLERSRVRYRCAAPFPGTAIADCKALVSGIELAGEQGENGAVLAFFSQAEPRTVLTFRSPSGTVRTVEIEVALVDPTPLSAEALVTLSGPLEAEGWLQILFVLELAPN